MNIDDISYKDIINKKEIAAILLNTIAPIVNENVTIELLNTNIKLRRTFITLLNVSIEYINILNDRPTISSNLVKKMLYMQVEDLINNLKNNPEAFLIGINTYHKNIKLLVQSI